MTSLLGLNVADVGIFIGLLLGMVIGYLQGMVRQMLGLAALYVGTILAAQYYRSITSGITFLAPGLSTPTANAIAFFVILSLATIIVNVLAYDAYRSTRLRIVPLLDQLGGIFLGFLAACFYISLALMVATYLTGAAAWLGRSEETKQVIVSALEQSWLVPNFLGLLPGIYDMVRPWLPAGLPAIFHPL